MQAPAHVAAALAFTLTTIMPQNLVSLQHYANGPAEASDELRRLLTDVSEGADTQLGISGLSADGTAVHLIFQKTQLSCKPLLQQLAAVASPEGIAFAPGTAKALLETLAHLVSLHIIGEP